MADQIVEDGGSGMRLGMVGLGRMGANLVRRLVRDGHQCVVYDVNPSAVDALTAQSDAITGAGTLDELVGRLSGPKVVWIMVPAAVAGEMVSSLAERMGAGDIIIDGGNTYYRDDIERAARCAARGIHYVDVGTSGGVWGLDRGYCLMIGGDEEAVAHLDPIFRSIAPGVDAAARTPGRTGDPSPSEMGYLHCGPPGAGHFVKMVHNGIEYGLMAAYAEGFNILRNADVGLRPQEVDAETTPLRDPQDYRFEIDLAEVAELWRRGSVIASWLLDLTAIALHEDPQLEHFEGRVSDSGEGRWTVLAAIDEGVPAHVLSAALFERFASRGAADFADRILSAMRKQFGGHDEKPGGPER
ncbi:MAG: decarboxylating 6-phosphogluconate dehydrogenase [Acidimicrobiales bacterium]